MRLDLLLSSFSLFALATAHGTHRRRAPTPQQLAREEIRAREHAIMARNCEPEIREHVAMRARRRAEIQKREGTPVARATSPHYTNIQNTTCLTAPEVVEGPYYVNNEFVRQDVRETQPGVQLLMDFGVMDTTTCSPMNYTFVEIWQANATGSYAGYDGFNTGHFNGNQTWLRGGWYTDANGMVELTTIYPGYYPGRAPHIHIMVHKNWVESANGTIASHSGSLVHIGQAFFNESWNDQVFKTSPYSSNTNQRTLNSRDQYLTQASQKGYNPYTNLQYLNGNDLSGGLVAYLTVGVDPRSSYSIQNTNYDGEEVQNQNQNVPSAAESHTRGWGNTLCLTIFMFAFFGYKLHLRQGPRSL